MNWGSVLDLELFSVFISDLDIGLGSTLVKSAAIWQVLQRSGKYFKKIRIKNYVEKIGEMF